MIRRILPYIFSFLLLTLAHRSYAQRPSSGFKPGEEGSSKPWIPENKEAKAAEEQEKEKADNPQRPLTKREMRRKMKREEKERRKAYDEHHDRIQTKAIRKRMKENEKRSKKINEHTGPSFWERLFKKKRR